MSEDANLFCVYPSAEHDTDRALPGYDLWLTFIKTVHVFEGVLDPARSINALGRCIDIYPHVSGRLARDGGTWWISMKHTPVLVQIVSRDDLFETLSPKVVQDDISHFIFSQASTSSSTLKDMPLLRIRVTQGAVQTAIGFAWHHVLGDASALLQFTRVLSDIYQDRDPFQNRALCAHDEYTPAEPSIKLLEDVLPTMPHLAKTYPLNVIGSMYATVNAHMCRVDCQLTVEDISLLRKYASSAPVHLSDQDLVTAWIANVIERSTEQPLSYITNAVSYRRVGSPFATELTLGNSICIIKTDLPPALISHEIQHIGTALRASITASRRPEFLSNWLSVASYRMLDIANAGEALFFDNSKGTLSVNSQVALDWNSCHFGYARSASFFTAGTSASYLRVFRANPAKEANGFWRSTDGTIELSFGIREEYQLRVMQIIDEDLNH